MTSHPQNPDPRAAAYAAALASGDVALAGGDPAAAYAAYERAHVLGQRRTGEHLHAHLAFLRWAWRQRDVREFFGQLSRIGAAALFSRIWVPVGNTGGARVSAFRPMPVAADVAELLAARPKPARDGR